MRLIALLTLALSLTVAATAQAHRLPPNAGIKTSLHSICIALGKCRDRPPQIGPNTPCSSANEGEIRTIYDPILKGEVDWQCRCPFPNSCGWYRLGIRQSAFTAFWRQQDRLYVRDWMRRCPSIVCKGRLVRHFYPAYWSDTL